MKSLDKKTAIITGASSGIGRETAGLFAREGANVIVSARCKAELDALVAEIGQSGGHAVALAGDVRSEDCAEALVDCATTEFGGLDIAFNNAGTLGAMGVVSEITLDGWNETLETNLTSAFFAAKYQVPAMVARGGGSLIFTSTFVGYTAGMPGMTAYAARKSALIGLAQALAVEFGAHKIRANAVLPGGIDTPMGAIVANTPETRAFVEGLHALKRTASAQEIAQSVLHLASDASSFVTGTAMLVDGGVSISRT